MLVRLLGHELYGQWVVIQSLTSYFGLANLGMGQTVGNMVAEAYASAQTRVLGQVVSTAFFSHILIAITLIIVAGLVAHGYFVHLVPLHNPSANMALVVTCVFAAFSLPFKVSSMTLRSLNRVDLEQITQTISNLLRAAALTVVLLAGFRLLAVALVHGFALVASGIAAYVIVNKISIDAEPRLHLFSCPFLKRMIAPSAAFCMLSIASTLAFSIDNLVIAYNLGAQAVTQYSVPFQIVTLNVGFFAVALGALTPSITAHHSRAADKVLSDAYALVMRMAILFGTGSALFLWLAGRPLVNLWVGPGVFPDDLTFGLQLVLLFLQVVLYPSHTVLIATSMHYGYAIVAIIEGVLNLILSLWWVRLFGMPGVVAGTIVARLLTNGWYLTVLAWKVLGIRGRDLKGLARGALFCSLSFLLLATLRPYLRLGSEIVEIGCSCAATCVFIAAFLALDLSARERVLVGKTLSRSLGRD
jgi:O-antigen/teichoic acid export membrane protein